MASIRLNGVSYTPLTIKNETSNIEGFQPVKSEKLTTSILEKALTLSQGTYEYSLGGSTYTSDDLPNSNYKYSQATVRTDGVGSTKIVILWGVLAGDTVIPPLFNLYNQGNWSGWNYFGDGGNAETLNGYDSEYFASAKSVKDNSLWYELTDGFDLNEALGRYRTSSTERIGTLLNKPSSVVGGELTVEWFPSNSNNKYGTQIIKQTKGSGCNIYFRQKQEDTWGEWIAIATTSDLEKYLPLTGGTLTGNMFISSSAPLIDLINIDKSIRTRVQNTSGGSAQFINYQDSTNWCGFIAGAPTEDISTLFKLAHRVNGTAKNYNILHEGNYSNYTMSVPIVLWENPDITATFAGQTITLNEEFKNCKYYEIICIRKCDSESGRLVSFSSGRIPQTQAVLLNLFTRYYYTRLSNIPVVDNCTIAFNDCMYTKTFGADNDLTDNTFCVPMKILGYKE